MRVGFVVIGVALMVVGAVLLFLPVSPQPPQTLTQSSEDEPAGFTIAGFSLTGDIPITVTWTANTTVEVVAVACPGTCSGENFTDLSGTNQTGTQGHFSLNVPVGGQVWIESYNPIGTPSSTSITINTALTSVGSILLVVGILLLIAGLFLKNPPKVPAPVPAETSGADPAPPVKEWP